MSALPGTDTPLSAVSDRVVARLLEPTERARGLPNEAFDRESSMDVRERSLLARGGDPADNARDDLNLTTQAGAFHVLFEPSSF